MIPFFGSRQRAANRDVVGRLNGAVIGAVRDVAFYLAGGVPDTFEGRFEILVLHVALVVRRLRAIPSPGPELGQALVDEVLGNLDPAMRELGVGDLAVPKRMKRLVEGFLGRAVAYDAALTAASEPSAALDEALRRNVYGGRRPAADLAAYVRRAADDLADQPGEAVLRGDVRFPRAAEFLGQPVPA